MPVPVACAFAAAGGAAPSSPPPPPPPRRAAAAQFAHETRVLQIPGKETKWVAALGEDMRVTALASTLNRRSLAPDSPDLIGHLFYRFGQGHPAIFPPSRALGEVTHT